MRLASSLAAAVPLLLLAGPVSAQTAAPPASDAEEMIRSASSAAPLSVTGNATIVDRTMPPSGDGSATVLREGSNGWVCMPDNPEVPGDSPACLDAPWRGFLEALVAGEQPPAAQGLGIAYMLRGDFPVSNLDPAATGPEADNEWIPDSGPHVMLLAPDTEILADLPTSPGDGPWVMWAGTPYAHVMVPVPGMSRH